MRILIVEDEPTLGPQLKATLEGAGYAVDLATDGEVSAGGVPAWADAAVAAPASTRTSAAFRACGRFGAAQKGAERDRRWSSMCQ